MSIRQIEEAVMKLSPREQEEFRDWLENFLEDRLRMTPEFQREIEEGKEDIRAGRVRIRKP